MASILVKNAALYGKRTDFFITEGKFSLIAESLNQPADQTWDLEGKKVYPGLVDVHIHGNSGHTADEPGFLDLMSVYEVRHGITSWCPTTTTIPLEDLQKATDVDIHSVDGAEVLGFHIEGPFISPKYKGAQNEQNILKPDLEAFETLKHTRLISMAPETEGAMEFIEKCKAVVCLGHTDTDYETAMEAFRRGANCVTHMMNAMPPLHHRKPALFGAAYMSNSYVQVICDGIHIHPAVISILYKLFGKERMLLISDSIGAAGMADGVYDLGGLKVIVKDRQARIEEGNLAGATYNLFDDVQKAIEFGIPEEEAYEMASATPAKLLGIYGRKGVIAPGADADFVVLQEDGSLDFTVARGKKWEKGEEK